MATGECVFGVAADQPICRIEDFPARLAVGVRLENRGDRSYALMSHDIDGHLVLDPLDVTLVEGFDGRPLREVVHEIYLETGKIPFSRMKALIERLARSGLLSDSQGALQLLGVRATLLTRILRRGTTLLSIPLGRRGARQDKPDGPREGRLADQAPVGEGLVSTQVPPQRGSLVNGAATPLVLTTIGVILLAVAGLPGWGGLLLPGGDPALGLLMLYLSLGLGRTVRSVGRRLYSPLGCGARLVLSLGILYVDVGSRGLVAGTRRARLSGAAAGVAAVLLCAALSRLLASRLAPGAPLAGDCLDLVAFGLGLVVLADLCPMGSTAAHDLFSVLTASHHPAPTALAYLRRKTVRRLLQVDFFAGERTWILHGSWVIAYTVVVFVIVATVVETTLPALIEALFLRPWSPGGALLLIVLLLVLLLASLALISVVGSLVLSSLPRHRRRGRTRDTGAGDLDRLVDRLVEVPLFRRQDRATLEQIASRARGVDFSRGTTLVRQGEQGDSFFVIMAGQVEVIFEELTGVQRRLARLQAGACFGETALIEEVPRTATVRGVSNGRALVISRSVFLDVFSGVEGAELVKLVRGASVLHESEVFAEMDAYSLEKMLGQLDLVEVRSGQRVISRGEEGTCFYIILEGELEVLGKDDEMVVARLGPGAPLGEIALLADVPRVATVVAASDGTLLSLEREAFFDLLSEQLELGERLERLGGARISSVGR